MNVAYNSALRQSKALRNDLDALSSMPPASLTPSSIGNVSASLSSFSKSIDEYAALGPHELAPKKKEEAAARAARFREDLSGFRARVDAIKRAREDAAEAVGRGELLGRRPYAATPENPYSSSAQSSGPGAANPYANVPSNGPSAFGSGPGRTAAGYGDGEDARGAHALREQNFFAGTNAALDEYIARGQAVLGDLGHQRETLKNTQKRLYSVANTLGVSGDTIKMVERRAREDKWIFGAGVIVFFLFCWLCIHFLR
ncbi:related to acyl-coenzyme A:6-aminopenicillanic-acid-acyltransferase precursor [Cephalotrichum gorgonifer]|uniref:Protein transport protein BOS1 n=1 Tax=Cephalotrichum gorgonifer TaxID=2041049 RepID=A0AAE8MWD9_9PEZI|nr:related to acyl-coenzyme A:6-aminopenicillanic-acid-acyltransferase precursor [Cephalotrichum gorgonifer]